MSEQQEPDRTVRPKDKLSGADALVIYKFRQQLAEYPETEEPEK